MDAADTTIEAPSSAARLYLASGSPRRRELLTEAGYAFEVVASGVDDGELDPGDSKPEHWVGALAYMKASAGAQRLACGGVEFSGADEGDVVVLGADTVCVVDGEIIGQPKDEAEARAMIRRFVGRTHQVLTGVAIVDGQNRRSRRVIVDRATVVFGGLSDAAIDAYVAGGAWRGKAGGYNLTERQAAGWPIESAGDPTTVVGLPMRRLGAELSGLGVRPRA